jgi:hypothetical protein
MQTGRLGVPETRWTCSCEGAQDGRAADNEAELARILLADGTLIATVVGGSRSAFCLAAILPAGRPPGNGGDRGVGVVQRSRCSAGRIAALGG